MGIFRRTNRWIDTLIDGVAIWHAWWEFLNVWTGHLNVSSSLGFSISTWCYGFRASRQLCFQTPMLCYKETWLTQRIWFMMVEWLWIHLNKTVITKGYLFFLLHLTRAWEFSSPCCQISLITTSPWWLTRCGCPRFTTPLKTKQKHRINLVKIE